MKKIIFTFFDICLLMAALFYSAFKYKKVSGEAWKFNNFQKAVLLANGPSLKKDIQKVINEVDKSEIYVLNYFAVTKYFDEIKPENYVLTDRMFWNENANDDIKKIMKNYFFF